MDRKERKDKDELRYSEVLKNVRNETIPSRQKEPVTKITKENQIKQEREGSHNTRQCQINRSIQRHAAFTKRLVSLPVLYCLLVGGFGYTELHTI